MDWQLVFFIDEHDNEPVKDFILQQSDGAIAEILHVFKLLRQFGTTLGMPYVRKYISLVSENSASSMAQTYIASSSAQIKGISSYYYMLF